MVTQVPFRLAVLKEVCACIEKITPANGFINDLSPYPDPRDASVMQRRVFRGRELFGADDPLPMVSVLEHPRALDALLESESGSDSIGEWDLMIQGFVEDDTQDPTDPAHLLSAEVIKALYKYGGDTFNLFGFGSVQPCVTEIKIGSPVVRPADGVNSSQAFFWVTMSLSLSERRENPFV